MKCMRCGKESKWELCRECKEVKHRAGALISQNKKKLKNLIEWNILETDRLRTALAEQRVIANNAAQTNELLSKLQPTPIPSWIVSSPYTSIYPPATTTAWA